MALAQALPGPASSQIGIAIGMMRAGWLGSLAAWLGFTVPSAAILIAFALGVESIGSIEGQDWLRGLQLAALPIVALAVWTMARNLAPDVPRASIALSTALAVLILASAAAQVAIIGMAGVAGWLLFRSGAGPSAPALRVAGGRLTAAVGLACFFGLLAGLPLLASLTDRHALDLFDAFYRSGSLVFGGGHVVLPLLEREVVGPGWVTDEQFLAGYGAAQAVPGPLFTFAAYLGTIGGPEPNGVAGGLLCLVAVFSPSFLLIAASLPLWSALRRQAGFQAALKGVNAAVVGLLLAALYDPIWTHAVNSVEDVALAVAGLAMLVIAKAPPWLVVGLLALGAEGLAAI